MKLFKIFGEQAKQTPSVDPEDTRRRAFERAVRYLKAAGFVVIRMPDGCALIMHPKAIHPKHHLNGGGQRL